jgi:dihydrofolate reductase
MLMASDRFWEMKHFKAIAAMSENRVIGIENRIPWHLPEDFKWFKKKTMGNIAVMGRKTFESLGKPLANRTTLILTRHPRRFVNAHPEVFDGYKLREWKGGRLIKRPFQFWFTKLSGERKTEIRVFGSLEKLDPEDFESDIFICGGAQIYEQALPRCSDLYLTVVKRTVEGDAFFPKFEDRFRLHEEIMNNAEFKILHYRNRGLETGEGA